MAFQVNSVHLAFCLLCCMANNGFAKVFVPTPGTVIDSQSMVNHEHLISPAVVPFINHHDFAFVVGEPFDFSQHPEYINASKNNRQTVTLGPESGDLRNYVSGRPFPQEPQQEDIRAGEKIAWNMRYAYAPDETNTELMTWMYKRMDMGSPDRTIDMWGAMMRFSHRHTRQPFPDYHGNSQNLFSALYLQVKSPQDLRNTQLLIHTNNDDAAAEQAWIYLNTQRRVRRVSTGQKTDAFLGSDIMIEDFLGYNGRIRDQRWRYLGSADTLVPMYAFNQLPTDALTSLNGHTVIDFSGPGQCLPKVSWQLRKVFLLEAIPMAKSHPISKRIFTIDAQTYAPVLTQIYDRANSLWKVGMVMVSDSATHFEGNSEWQGPKTDAVSMIDVQALHCTTIQFVIRIPDDTLDAKTFTTQFMRSTGR